MGCAEDDDSSDIVFSAEDVSMVAGSADGSCTPLTSGFEVPLDLGSMDGFVVVSSGDEELEGGGIPLGDKGVEVEVEGVAVVSDSLSEERDGGDDMACGVCWAIRKALSRFRGPSMLERLTS
jgi:hypothetical protein